MENALKEQELFSKSEKYSKSKVHSKSKEYSSSIKKITRSNPKSSTP